MFEDSYLDSFMESYIGGWTGDEDQQDDNWWSDRWEDDADEVESYEEWDDDTPGDGDRDYPDEVIQPDDWILDDGDF